MALRGPGKGGKNEPTPMAMTTAKKKTAKKKTAAKKKTTKKK